MALTDKLTAIADAIREKTGSTEAMTLDEMAEGITGLDTSGGSSTKYNATIDNLLGDTDDDGVLQAPSDSFSLIFTGVKDIGKNALFHAFYGCTSLTSLDLSGLTDVSGSYGMNYAFCGCTSLTSAAFPNLTDVSGSYGMSYAFYSCTGLTSLDLSALETISDSGMSYAFYGTGVTSLDLPSLTSLGQQALYCNTTLTKIWIPSTCTTISASRYSYSPFYQCSSSLEIFTDAEAALDGWGAYWNYYGSGGALTVHYGATHEEFEQGYMNEDTEE